MSTCLIKCFSKRDHKDKEIKKRIDDREPKKKKGIIGDSALSLFEIATLSVPFYVK